MEPLVKYIYSVVRRCRGHHRSSPIMAAKDTLHESGGSRENPPRPYNDNGDSLLSRESHSPLLEPVMSGGHSSPLKSNGGQSSGIEVFQNAHDFTVNDMVIAGRDVITRIERHQHVHVWHPSDVNSYGHGRNDGSGLLPERSGRASWDPGERNDCLYGVS